MKINSILNIFAPKESRFFPLLEETATILDNTATFLLELFTTDQPERSAELVRLIKAEESRGDKTTGKIFKELNNTFITPFDREDITGLADVMDDAIDSMHRAANKVALFAPKSLPQSTAQMAEIIQQAAVEIKAAVLELSNLQKNDRDIRKHTKKIKHLEEAADTVYERGTSQLFRTETDAIELVKLKEIIQELEKSANTMNGVGKALKMLIIKYS
ncbi:MAG: DUF47 family protein [Bacteroidales bacterium]|jgi:predicted phosphate transport protein (TIGR00153 family)|nr:DUF47 family protein [Bacteroidales bacterium]